MSNFLKVKLNPKQLQAWDLLIDKKTRFILFGGSAGPGKTWLGCEFLLIMATTFPGTRWAMCRAELKSLRQTTLATFYKVVAHHDIVPDTILKYNDRDSQITFHNGSMIDLLDLKYEPSDPYYARLGSYELTGAFIDEAGDGVHIQAFDILKSRIGRQHNEKYGIMPKILLCANPSKGFLYHLFYKPFKDGTLPENMAFVTATLDDNKYLSQDYKDQLESMTSTANKERLIRGNWEYADEKESLIQYNAILDAFSGIVGAKVKPADKVYLTCDVARFGADSTVITVWVGLRVEKIFQYQNYGVTQTHQVIKNLMSQYHIPVSKVVIDQDGIGGGLCDLLPGCVNFKNGGSPVVVRNQTQNFTNLKSQCYVKLAELINARDIFINLQDPTIKEKLIQELEYVRLKDAFTDGKLAIMAKKEVKEMLGRSPDLSDALMLRMYYEVRPAGGIRVLSWPSVRSRNGGFY